MKARYDATAARVKPPLDWLSNVSLILLIVLITVVNFDKVLQVFGTRGILAGLLFIALGFCIGWLLGGPGNDTRPVLALAHPHAAFSCVGQSLSRYGMLGYYGSTSSLGGSV